MVARIQYDQMKKTKIEPGDELSVTEAALLVGMSPELLSWFISHAPKWNDSRKLPLARKIEGVPVFKKSELVDFNVWLSKPWPAPVGARPHIPTKIRDEIINEVGNLCAICHEHSKACEAAHIDPVAQSKNNHPHNLIWLCANHHTEYDKGVIGPLPGEIDFIKNYKGVLLGRARHLYAIQAGAVREALQLLENCHRASQLDPKTQEQHEVAEEIAKEVFQQITEVKKKKPKAATEVGFTAFQKLETVTTDSGFSTASIKKRLDALSSVRDDFRLAADMVKCPLCQGKGCYADYDDCPFCAGDGAVPSTVADYFDPSIFEEVECELCEGSGQYDNYDLCPICHGNTKLERRLAERTDFDAYRKVKCRLCKGRGQYGDYDACPFCGGDGEVPRGRDDIFDPTEFGQVRCDVCNGKGSTNYYDTCRKCDGQGELERRLHELRDKRDYALVDCPLCGGDGAAEYDDCSQCAGYGKIPRYLRD